MLTGRKVFIHSSELDQYPYPAQVPYSSLRAGKTRQLLFSIGHLFGQDRGEVAPEPASDSILRAFHTPRYLEALRQAEQRAGALDLDLDALRMGIGSQDCPIFKGMYRYATLACGATLTGARMILSGEVCIAFNPSGGYHHAGPEHAAGFCYINDVVLACIGFTEAGKKVFYLDIDAHHGDGVQNAFYDRRDVMTVSIHESGQTLFPGTGYLGEIGTGEGTGYNLNVPLPMQTHDEVYMRIFREAVLPLLEVYNPDIIVVEIGADGLANDPIAHLRLTSNVYEYVLDTLLDFEKPILATGGGGYRIEDTVRAWALCWTVLCGDSRHYDMSATMGGVMLESTDWQGGLRDRQLVPDETQIASIGPIASKLIRQIEATVFPFHGI